MFQRTGTNRLPVLLLTVTASLGSLGLGAPTASARLIAAPGVEAGAGGAHWREAPSLGSGVKEVDPAGATRAVGCWTRGDLVYNAATRRMTSTWYRLLNSPFYASAAEVRVFTVEQPRECAPLAVKA